MSLEDTYREWKQMLLEEFNICLIKSRIPGFDSDWGYPSHTYHLHLAKNRRLGCLFSCADSDVESNGVVRDHQFIVIGGSANGANLIMKVSGRDLGKCKWIAPGYEYSDPSFFGELTSSFVGEPADVLREMIEKGVWYARYDYKEGL